MRLIGGRGEERIRVHLDKQLFDHGKWIKAFWLRDFDVDRDIARWRRGAGSGILQLWFRASIKSIDKSECALFQIIANAILLRSRDELPVAV